MLFNGADVAEKIDLSANGNRLRFFRDVGNITMDTDGVETVDFNALGGADTVTVNDLAGTDVTQRQRRPRRDARRHAGDGQADSVIVNGTNGNDAIAVSGRRLRCRRVRLARAGGDSAPGARPTSSPSTASAATTRSRRPRSPAQAQSR